MSPTLATTRAGASKDDCQISSVQKICALGGHAAYASCSASLCVGLDMAVPVLVARPLWTANYF
jgi:hypothetical protein